MHCTVWDHVAVFCHMTHYVTVETTILKTVKESEGIFFATLECKTLELYPQGACLLHNRYFKGAKSG